MTSERHPPEPPPAEDLPPHDLAADERGAGPAGASPGGDGVRRSPWRRLVRSGSPRATKANVLAGVLAVGLGLAIVTQVQLNREAGLEQLRQDELIQVLDDVSQRSARLDQQERDLQAELAELQSGAGDSAEAMAQAQRRLDALRLLAGTAPASGPGVRVTVTDPDATVTSTVLLDMLQELRDAGAEVVQFGDVRVVVSSAFADQADEVTLDGVVLKRPIVVLAIGDRQTLSAALKIPGGVVETVRRVGASATIESLPEVTITAVVTPTPLQYASPVADAASETSSQ